MSGEAAAGGDAAAMQRQYNQDQVTIGQLERQGEVDRALLAQLEADDIVDRERIADLETALITARRIGAAMGVLMNAGKITELEAFAVLRTASQTQHRKLRDVAEDVLLTGSLEAPS